MVGKLFVSYIKLNIKIYSRLNQEDKRQKYWYWKLKYLTFLWTICFIQFIYSLETIPWIVMCLTRFYIRLYVHYFIYIYINVNEILLQCSQKMAVALVLNFKQWPRIRSPNISDVFKRHTNIFLAWAFMYVWHVFCLDLRHSIKYILGLLFVTDSIRTFKAFKKNGISAIKSFYFLPFLNYLSLFLLQLRIVQ